MMRMKNNQLVSAALGAALLAGSVTQATGKVEETNFNLATTMDLYAICSVDSASPNFIPAIYACRGFIEGAVQYHDAVVDRKDLKRLICYGETATLEEGRNAFLQWVRANKRNGQYMNEIPVVGLVRALADKYPCSK
jgi:hypothetical protein